MLSIFSAFFFFLLLEFVVFRFIYPASDIAVPAYVDGLVRYQAGQNGVLRVKNEIESQFKINANGWNSKYKQYQLEKNSDKYRVAVIGDSYIAAFQVDYQKSVAEQLEAKLGDKNTEVYRFGIDGAPLSQYLYMMREEVTNYKPDLMIVNVVHNDFNESYSFVQGVFRSSFMKLDIKNNKVKQEVMPVIYKSPWYSWIREKSATWKFLAYRQKVDFSILKNMILGNDHDVEYLANIDVSRMKEDAINNRVSTDYIFKQMKETCDSKGIELIIVMDADDTDIYKNPQTEAEKSPVLQLNKMAAEVAQKYDIHFIDLQGILEKEYALKKKRFGFINDGHWNEYTHDFVASVLANFVKTEIKPEVLVNLEL